MKLLRSKLNSALTRVGLTLGLSLALVGAANAAPGVIGPNVWPNTVTNLTVPATVSAGATSNLVSQPIKVVPGQDLSIAADVTGGGTTDLGAKTCTVNGMVSIDGTNFTGSKYIPFVLKFNLADTNRFVAYTNIASSTFGGAASVGVLSVANADSNTLTINSIKLGHARVVLR